MPRKTLKDLLAEANRRLKSGNCAVKLNQQEGRIYLRGTLPPKSGSGRSKPYQQRINIGVYFNPSGIKRAESDANEVNRQLMMNQFDWQRWSGPKQLGQVGPLVAAFERDYFTRRDRNSKSETTWSKDYQTPLNRLPSEAELTADLLVSAVESYAPDTRARQRACNAYSALALFAGVEVDLKPYRGDYKPTAVRRDAVPMDELILEWDSKIPDPNWQNFYRLVACYGLRNHEAFYVDLKELKTEPIAVVQEGKTGYRAAVLPCPLGWWRDWFEGKELTLPGLSASSNSAYGNKTSQYFRRLGLPFRIYDLRHAHAGRMAMKGIDPAIAAKSQGHSLKVHSEIYLNFLGADQLRGMLDQLE